MRRCYSYWDPWHVTSLVHCLLEDNGLRLVRVKVIAPQPGNISLECKGSGNYSKASKSLSVSKRLPAYKVKLVLEGLEIYWVLFKLANLASHYGR